MSHTERQDVTYYSGHVIEVNGTRYAPECTGLVAEDNMKLIDRCRELECELARVRAELGNLERERESKLF